MIFAVFSSKGGPGRACSGIRTPLSAPDPYMYHTCVRARPPPGCCVSTQGGEGGREGGREGGSATRSLSDSLLRRTASQQTKFVGMLKNSGVLSQAQEFSFIGHRRVFFIGHSPGWDLGSALALGL